MGIFLILRKFAVFGNTGNKNDLPIDSYTFCEEMYKQTVLLLRQGSVLNSRAA